MIPSLIHFYAHENLGDAAILAGLERLAGGKVRILQPEEGARPEEFMVSVGGDIFNNGRPGLITRRFLNKLGRFREAPERTILFGQSVPPSCSGVALRMLGAALRPLASVTVRDQLSQQKLARYGVDARLSVDTAFALTAEDADVGIARGAFAALGVGPDEAAVISIRNFNRMYPIDEASYIERMAALCQALAGRGLTPVLMLQAEVNDADADSRIAVALGQQAPALKVLDPFGYDVPAWQVALGVLKTAHTIIGTRYHTAVLAMVAGRMPVGLWYSNKGEDLHNRFYIPGAEAASFDPAETAEMALWAGDHRFDPVPLNHRVRADWFDAVSALKQQRAA